VDDLETVAIDRAKLKSDSLLLALLRAKRPSIYGPKIDIRHDIDEPVQLIFSAAEVGDADEPAGEDQEGTE
jgi:hypothetical protein